MKKISVLLFLLSFQVHAQSDTLNTFLKDLQSKPIQSGLLLEFGFQTSTYGSVGAVVGRNFGKINEPHIGFGAALDVYYNGLVATFGPRAILFVSVTNNIELRFSGANYMQENNELRDIRLCAEIGISFAGRYTLNVGLGLPLNAQRFEEVGNFRVGLSVNLAK